MNIILASASPRRKELLKKLYQDFLILPTDVDESLPEDIGPEFAPVFLSAIKADAIAENYPNDLIIAADTVVICDGEIFGKPKDHEDAKRMLSLLSDKTHKVITGCCLSLGMDTVCFSEESLVTFFPLSEKEIDEYVRSGEPMGKAGAYAIQGDGALLVKKIDGDYSNIVGLPVARLKREIEDFFLQVQENKNECR